MIKFITADEVLPVRNAVLREGRGLTNDKCRFPTDHKDGNFHLGYYIKGELVSVVSFHPQSYGGFSGDGYQLRGMATIAKFQGQGIGGQLVNFAAVHLLGQKAAYVWCNGRKKALKFYLSLGFEIVSPEFDIPGTGLHHALCLKLR